MKSTSWSVGLSVTGDGTGVVAHAGSAAVRLLADRTGLTGALSGAVARRGFTPGHDRGRVLVDVATMITAGGEAIADIDTLRHQEQVLGAVASAPTVWRALDEVGPGALKRIEKARAKVRAGVWGLIPGGLPASKIAGTTLPADVVVLDVDATIVVAHSEKEQATRTFKKTFGYHPIGVWCDNSGEFLAASLRPGNAGSNTTADHLDVLARAIDQVPASYRRKVLVRADGAGASHGLLDWLTSLNTAAKHGARGRSVEYSVGFAVTESVRDAITLVPKKAWTAAIDTDGDVREHADVVEITGLLPDALREAWPAGMRVIVRREHPHPGAQLSLFEERDGWRYQAFVTNTTTGQVGFLEARHRAHARVEDRIRVAKDTGLGRFPSREYAINHAWLTVVQVAADLLAWLRLLALPDALKACEPKALRYRFLHIPARLTRGARRRHLRLPQTWPWVTEAVATFTNVMAIPMRT
ncbi:MAG: IS1380 family transposase [Candidatus Phosphoribacter baldrii]|nr:IS1380 family transposase [Candidatus Phosphoribacter baldrii]MBK6442753.1 IS1380 family transposase [Candidatus Phosphoribacter baldrii]MBK6443341.1 IS1380 family transposase [Candidatus Phosphoribacter baldrii]MBK6954955.1 IS1380 family transposase [Candidatus Phosphoribacter baldrii]MBK6954976.1 IS1380 family transposase [Candidatus Phosphoribacter baldrii]